VDLTEVTFFAGGGVTFLLTTAAELAGRNRRLAVIAPPGPARTRLRSVGADRRLGVFADRVDAPSRLMPSSRRTVRRRGPGVQ